MVSGKIQRMLKATEDVFLSHSLPPLVVEKMVLLEAEIQSLKSQLDWFKQQLFGQKSEKRLVDENPHQASLLAGLSSPVSSPSAPATEEITYTRRKGKQRDKSCVTEQGLRFDDSVPVEQHYAARPRATKEYVDYAIRKIGVPLKFQYFP